MSNGALSLPLTWILTTAINVSEVQNGAQLLVLLDYKDGNSTTGQVTAQSTFDFYALFLSKPPSNSALNI